MIAKLILFGVLAVVQAGGPIGYAAAPAVGIKYAQPAVYGARLQSYAPAAQTYGPAVQAYAPAVQAYAPAVQAYAPAALKVATPLHAAVKVAEPSYPPQPYEFGYEVSDEHGHGSFNQHESGDEHGNKKGSYTIKGNDGLYRTVEYVADEHGFRAHVSTNEPGTAPISPADVMIDSKPVQVQAAPQVVKAVASAPVYAQQYASAPALLKAPVYAQQYAAPQAILKAPVYASQQVYARAPAVLKAPVYAQQYAAPQAFLKAPVYASQQVYASAPAVLKAPVYAQQYATGPALLKSPVYGQQYATAPALLKAPAFASAAPIYANAGPLYAKSPLSQGHHY